MNPGQPGSALPSPIEPEETARLLAPLHDRAGVLLAVSGGPDSTAMLGLAARWAGAEGGPALFAATVDHGLREASRDEAESVGHLCARLGIPHHVLAWEGEKPASGLQEAARAARYHLLVTHAQAIGAGILVTAHTLDDQAETVLMRLAHGSGLAGLAGMRPLRMLGGIAHRRPFLSTPKARLVATCRAMELPATDDPSNHDPRHERTRWRGLAPMLAGAGLRPERLGLLAQRLGRAEDALEAAAAAAFARHAEMCPAGATLRFRALLTEEAEEIGLRVLGRCTRLVAPDPALPSRLRRLETLFEALALAAREGRPLRRTLGRCLIDLDAAGHLRARAEAPRRRGVAAP